MWKQKTKAILGRQRILRKFMLCRHFVNFFCPFFVYGSISDLPELHSPMHMQVQVAAQSVTRNNPATMAHSTLSAMYYSRGFLRYNMI